MSSQAITSYDVLLKFYPFQCYVLIYRGPDALGLPMIPLGRAVSQLTLLVIVYMLMLFEIWYYGDAYTYELLWNLQEHLYSMALKTGFAKAEYACTCAPQFWFDAGEGCYK